MRRLLFAAVLLALPAAVPTVASAASYEYLTTHQQYTWTTYDYEKVTARKDGAFSRRNTRYIAANGH